MPRIMLTPEQRREARIRDGNEALVMALAMSLLKSGQTQRSAAEKMGVHETKICSIKAHPGSMKLDTFRDLVQAYGLSDAAIVAIVKGKRLL